MSDQNQIVQPPLDVVKVEVEVDDESEGSGTEFMEGGNELDQDKEMLETVADLLSNGPWLSRGSEEEERLGRRLLDLGMRLEGWKKWEGLCRFKVEQLEEVRERAKQSELRFEMMKGAKAELRKTYDLEVERRIKAEKEVAELRKTAGGVVVHPVLKEVSVQTEASSELGSDSSMVVLQGSTHSATPGSEGASPGEEDEVALSSSYEAESADEGNFKETEEATVPNSTASFPGTSYNLRRKCSRRRTSTENMRKVQVAAISPHEESDEAGEGDGATTTNTPSRQLRGSRPRITDRSASGRKGLPKSKAVPATKNNLSHSLKEVRGRKVVGSFSCYVCNKRFLHRSNFRQHLKTHPIKESYSCKTCGKTLKNRKGYRQHLKYHDDYSRERKYMCLICKLACVSPSRLAIHMVIHQPDKPFKCPKCPCRFRLSYALKDHLAVHSERKPFGCELCEKSFKRLIELVRHRRVHSGERPYSCHICDKEFSQACHLNDHIRRIHQGEEGKLHQCPLCNKRFVQKYECRRHQQRCHKSEVGVASHIRNRRNAT